MTHKQQISCECIKGNRGDCTCPSTFNYNDNIKRVNRSMLKLKEKLHELQVPSFGSSLYDSSDSSCVFHNRDTIIASVITDRILGKFEPPDHQSERTLRQECAAGWIDYERGHLTAANAAVWDTEVNSRVNRATANVHWWLNGSSNGKNFRYDRSFWFFADKAPLELGPGESFISRKGDVSLFSKLDPNTMTVTHDCVELALCFIMANKGLREIYREHLNGVLPSRKRYFPEFCGPYEKGHVFFETHEQTKERIRSFLVARNLIQYGSRGSSVYKNSEKRRFINVECLLNVVIQKIAGWSIRQCLRINAGCDLDLGQDLHKRLISTSISTIDWSNASDSILSRLVKCIFRRDPKILNLLETTRSHFVLIDTPIVDLTGPRTDKQYHRPLKFSSMGNGFTFELLTLVNLAFVRSYDSKSSVYGDDVIINNDYAYPFIHVMKQLGFNPNLKKSFINLPFRESCGGFFLDGYGYIRSYDFKWNTTMIDVITTANKLRRVIDYNKGWNHKVRDELIKTYSEVCLQISTHLVGPCSDDTLNIPTWCERSDISIYRKHSRDNGRKAAVSKISNVAERYIRDFLKLENHKFVVVDLPEYRGTPKVTAQRSVKSLRLAYSYILSGRTSDMLLRVDKSERVIEHAQTLLIFNPNEGDLISIRVEQMRGIMRSYTQARQVTLIKYLAVLLYLKD